MNRKNPVFSAEYIIDGVRKEFTPQQILEESAGDCPEPPYGENLPDTGKKGSESVPAEPVVDETVDPAPSDCSPVAKDMYRYLGAISRQTRKPRNIPSFCSASVTRGEAARALIDTVWRTGHFRLDDLQLSVRWDWNSKPVGNMASFYSSVESLWSYLDLLGIKITEYGFRDNQKNCSISFNVSVEGEDPVNDSDDVPDAADIAESIDRDIVSTPEPCPAVPSYELPFKTADPKLGKGRICSSRVSRNRENWLIYIPFDTCKFRLGGSLLSEVTGISGGKAPDIRDSDYFIDCFEVVREFAEDGVITSGTTVGPGGLMAALGSMTTAFNGIDADISGIIQSYGENDIIKILFSEVPGVLVEIKDCEFDYVDAELLLQDVAYYPVGHPGRAGLRISCSGSSGSIPGILQSLLDVQAAEGED